jgi:hypothetical protein
MTSQAKDKDNSSEVIRYGGAGTTLLLSLLALVGLHPLLLGGIAARIAGGLILATILVAGTIAASQSAVQRAISGILAISALALQFAWLVSGNVMVEAALMAAFSAFCLYTAMVILRRVLSFGPLYADRVHAALSVYVLLALFWAGAYALVEISSPGAFSIATTPADSVALRESRNLLPQMFHLSIATLTSTGFGDITPVAPFARSLNQLEQLTGVFYIAVLISRLVGLYPGSEKDRA